MGGFNRAVGGYQIRKQGTARLAVNNREAEKMNRDRTRARIWTKRQFGKNLKSRLSKVSRLNSEAGKAISKRMLAKNPRFMARQMRKKVGTGSGSNSAQRFIRRTEIHAAKQKKHNLNQVVRGDLFT